MNEFDFIPDSMMDDLVNSAADNDAIRIINGKAYINWAIVESLMDSCIEVDNSLGGDGTRGVAVALLAVQQITQAAIAKNAADTLDAALGLISSLGDSHATKEEEGE